MTIDKHKLAKAREWATKIGEREVPGHLGDLAEVILSLPEVIVDGDKVRLLMEEYGRISGNPDTGHIFAGIRADLDALLPTPAPRVEIALGAWAMHPEHGKVLISSDKADSAGDVRVHVKDPRSAVGTAPVWVPATDLSPLPDTQEPRKLTSFREYKSAGVGTVIRDGSETTTKEDHGYWRDTDGIDYTDGDMAGVTSTVLWEPGGQA